MKIISQQLVIHRVLDNYFQIKQKYQGKQIDNQRWIWLWGFDFLQKNLKTTSKIWSQIYWFSSDISFWDLLLRNVEILPVFCLFPHPHVLNLCQAATHTNFWYVFYHYGSGTVCLSIWKWDIITSKCQIDCWIFRVWESHYESLCLLDI